MSISALLRGVETRLRSSACLNDQPAEAVGKVCGVQPDAEPPANFGQFYCAVYFNGLKNLDPNAQSMDFGYSVGVAVTARMGYAPGDRRGKRAVATADLLDRALQVAAWLHQDDLHRIEANKLITGTAEWAAAQAPPAVETVNGFLTPLKHASISAVQDCRPGWGGTDGENDMLWVDVRFIDAQRVQYIGS